MWSLVLLLGFFPAIALVGWLMGVVRRKIDKRRIFNLRCGHGFFTNHDPSVQCPECRKEMDELIARNEARAVAQAAEREAMSVARRALAIEEAATRRLEDEMCRQEHEEQMRLSRRIEHLRQMDPYEFELFVVEIFRLHGWEGRATPRSNDLGVDARMRKGEATALIQCKRYGDGSPVGRPAVQALCGQVGKEKASVGYVVTTSYFSEQAIRWAHDQKIQLIDHRKLIAMIKEVIKDDTHLSSVPATHGSSEAPSQSAPANGGRAGASNSSARASDASLSATVGSVGLPLYQAAQPLVPAASGLDAVGTRPKSADAATVVARLAAHPRRAANLDGDNAAKASEYLAQFDPARGPVRQHPSDYLPPVQAGGEAAAAPTAHSKELAPKPVVPPSPPKEAEPRRPATSGTAGTDPRIGHPLRNAERQVSVVRGEPWMQHAAMIVNQRASGICRDVKPAAGGDGVHRSAGTSPAAGPDTGLAEYFTAAVLATGAQDCIARRVKRIVFDPISSTIYGTLKGDCSSQMDVTVKVKVVGGADGGAPKLRVSCGCAGPIPCHHIAALLIEIGGMGTACAFLKDVAEQGAFCNRNPEPHHALSAYQFYRDSRDRVQSRPTTLGTRSSVI